VEREGVTHAMVVPTMLARIVDALDRRGGEPLLGVRALSYGGGKMPHPVIERALELFPITSFVNAYGLTETSSTIALLGPDDHRLAQYSEDPIEQRRLASTGRPLPGVELSIRDDAGNEVPGDEVGEIFVRGEQVSGEYLEKGSLLDDEGWFRTRDSGFIDDGGYLFVLGRNDDVIIRGGENMSPGEIEDVLLTHDGVKEAAAIGVPDTEWGERVLAVVVLGNTGCTEAELQTLVRDRLRSSRVPAHVVFVDELPYNDTGKLLRRVLREDHAHLGDVPAD
jgi:acyl-CoA synthetase (AMP-forming)/AMP-acid ligase II